MLDMFDEPPPKKGSTKTPSSSMNMKRRKTPPKLPLTELALEQSQPEPSPICRLSSITYVDVNGAEMMITITDLKTECELGAGGFGSVERMRHVPSGTLFAVKLIRQPAENEPMIRMVTELEVLRQSKGCEFAVQFYGALRSEGYLWILNEVMTTSMDKFYRTAFELKETIPEPVLGRIAYSMISGLLYLHRQLQIMHRDVKPGNILINRDGAVKICDYGVSCRLVNSIAKTLDVGSRPYMPFERIIPSEMQENDGYDIRSDVWSVGVTMMEVATGRFPFGSLQGEAVFHILREVIENDPPRLPKGQFTPQFESFIEQCLQKDYTMRPRYEQLLEHEFITMHQDTPIELSWLNKILDATVKSMEKSV